MFVKKVRTDKGIIERGKYGIDRIDVDEENHLVTYYTAGGNIYTAKLKKILNKGEGCVVNSRNYHKNLYSIIWLI